MTATSAERDAGKSHAEARKAPRIARQETRRLANIEALGSLYQPRAIMTQYRWRHLYDFKAKAKVWTLVPVTVSMPPSKQLDRLRFKRRAVIA